MLQISLKSVVTLLLTYCMDTTSAQGFGQPCQLPLLGGAEVVSRCVVSSVPCVVPGPLLTCNSGYHCCLLNLTSVPDSIDWRDYGIVTPAKNQGSCSSDWAFSVVEAIQSRHAKETGTLVELSAQQLVDCDASNSGCNGGNLYSALQYVQANGLMSSADYPYVGVAQSCAYNETKVAVRIAGFGSIQGENAMRDEVGRNGPVPITLNAIAIQGDTIYNNPNCPRGINHVVSIVGYGTEMVGQDYWLVKNSWGTSWGTQGVAKVRRGVNMCAINGDYSWAIELP